MSLVFAASDTFAPRATPSETVSGRGGKSFAEQLGFLVQRVRQLPPSVILSSTMINLLGLALPLVILQIYDRVLPQQSIGTLYVLTASLVAVTAAEAVLKLARSYLTSSKSIEMAYRDRYQAVAGLLYAPWQKISEHSPRTLQNSLAAVDEITGAGKTVDQTVLLDLPYVGLFLLLTWMVGGMLVIVPIAIIVIFFGLTLWASRNYRRTLESRTDIETERYNFIAEVLRGIGTVKLLAMEPFMQRRAEKYAESAAENSHRIILESNRFLSLGQLFASITMIMVVTAGAYLVIGGEMSVGSLACCTLLATRTTQPVLRTIGAWSQLQSADLAERQASTVMALGATQQRPPVTREQGARLELQDVTLPVSGGGRLENVSLTVEPGEIVGLAGASGCGKSSVLSLIAGQIKPISGSVRIGGADIFAKKGDMRLRDVAFIGSKPVIFRGTILQNIAMFRTGQAEQDAVRAIALIGFEDQINHLPEGFETMLGEATSDLLPRRFLQAVVLARALTARAKIVLIDEASTHFTHSSQMLFRNAVKAFSSETTFILTDQRIAKLNFADRIFVVENGRLVPVTQDNLK